MMENKVIMSLNDYNALKRKADAFESAITINTYSTWVDININPKAIKPAVDLAVKAAIEEGALDKERLQMKPSNEWFGSITIATLKPEVQEEPPVLELE